MGGKKVKTLKVKELNQYGSNFNNIIISVHDFTNKILSRESNYIVDSVM